MPINNNDNNLIRVDKADHDKSGRADKGLTRRKGGAMKVTSFPSPSIKIYAEPEAKKKKGVPRTHHHNAITASSSAGIIATVAIIIGLLFIILEIASHSCG